MNPQQYNTEEAVFVDEQKNVFKGHKAVELIQSRKLDSVDPEKGVIRVDPERWQEAQRYERRTWMEGVASMSDRNEEHESCFGGYRSIHGKHFASGIELGCGPFTNMRKILGHCRVDDMIPWNKRGGFKHPLRFYKHKVDEWKTGRLMGRPITLHASGIEDFKAPIQYDLCIMINVIEHCRDVEAIFARILEMTAPGSHFLFADKIYDARSEVELAKTRFDAGHPLRVDHSVIRRFLSDHFNPLWNAEVLETDTSQAHQCSYFIGTRR
jgi:SAM-dependent methyltransferase